MKKILTLGMGILLLFAIGSSTTSCSKEKEEKSVKAQEQRKEAVATPDDIAKYFPENTEFVIKLGSVETIYEHFSVTENRLLGEIVDNEDMTEIKAHFGFNPFEIKELKANGFDTGKEFGFLICDFQWQITDESAEQNEDSDEPAFNGLIFMPVTDTQKAISAIEHFFKDEEGSTLKTSKQGNMTLFEEDGEKVYVLEKDNYIFIGMNPKADAKAFMESVAAGTVSLTNTNQYKAVISEIDSKQEIFAYANIRKIAEKNLEAIKALSKRTTEHEIPDMSKKLEYLKEYEGIGISADIESKDFVAKIVANIAEGSKILNMLKDISFDRNIILGMKENPAVLISFAINMPEYYKMILDTLTEEEKKNLKSTMEETKMNFGVDLEKEIIENLGGNFNLGIYDGVSINMTNYNTLLTMNVKDEAKMKNVLANVVSKLPPNQQSMIIKTKIGDTEVYALSLGIAQLYVGVKDKNLIISVGKPMFEKAINSDISTGFISAMQDKELVRSLKEDAGVFYLNVAETFYAVKNFSAFIPLLNQGEAIDKNLSQSIRQFDYLLSANKIKGNTMFNDLIIKTKFTEPFFKGLEKISKSLQVPENTSQNPK